SLMLLLPFASAPSAAINVCNWRIVPAGGRWRKSLPSYVGWLDPPYRLLARPGGGLRLPEDRPAGAAGAGARLGPDPRGPRLPPTTVRLPRPAQGVRPARLPRLRPEHAGHRLPAGIGGAPPHPLPGPERRRPRAGAGAAAADLRGRRPGAAQAPRLGGPR